MAYGARLESVLGANPPSSASKWRRPVNKGGKSPLSAFRNEKSPSSRNPKIPPSIAVHRRIPPEGVLLGALSQGEKGYFLQGDTVLSR